MLQALLIEPGFERNNSMKAFLGKMMVTSAALGLLVTPAIAGPYDLRTETSSSYTTIAATQTDAQQFIASMGDRGINFLGDEKMSQEAKQKEFKRLLNDSFDMNTIGRFALGTYWNSATPAQQKEYMKLFNDMIIRVYSKRFSDYKGQKFDVRSSQKQSEKDTLVTSYIVPNDGPEVRVDWRVRNKGGTYKVVDVVVEGVSMGQTQRSDFSSVIQRGGGKVEVLLDYLRK
jgi:phospholipid transport system substrate-binding protein